MEAVASEVTKEIFAVELDPNYTQAVRHFKKMCPDHPQPHQQVVRGLDRYWCIHAEAAWEAGHDENDESWKAARKALGLCGGLTVWRDLTEEWHTVTLENGRIRIELDETVLAATRYFTENDPSHMSAEKQVEHALLCYWTTDLFSGLQAYEIAQQTPAPNPAQCFDPATVAEMESLVNEQLEKEGLL